MKKKFFTIGIIGLLFVSGLLFSSLYSEPEKVEAVEKPANVIVLITDGTSAGAITLARWYKGEKLALDDIAAGTVRTYSAESAITDSAPAATAMATGFKSNDKYIGLLPSKVTTPGVKQVSEKNQMKPIANIIEAAERLGKATGIVATAEIQHATPASFSAHASHRNHFQDIAEQQVYQGMEVVLGGGKQSLLPGNGSRERKDKENLLKVIKNQGYDYVENKNELMKSKSKKIWGMFADQSLAYDIDRKTFRPEEPTLAEMTRKAISTLSKNRNGFFLMVEGSKADWSAHENEPIGVISDVLAFDKAVKEALQFAKKDGNTLVMAVTDHGNSGITLGHSNLNSTYPLTPVSAFIEPLKKATLTLNSALSYLEKDRTNMKEVAELYGLTDLTNEEMNKLKSTDNLGPNMSSMLAKRAHIGFITTGHTGEDIFLYSFGPNRPLGTIENTDIAKIAAQFMGISLDQLNQDMYQDAEDLFRKRGYQTRIDTTQPYNPIFMAIKEKKVIKLPQNKNRIYINGKQKCLKEVTVFNGKKFFVSTEALKVAESSK